MTAFLVMALIRVIDFSMKLYKIMVLFNFHGMFKCMLNIYIYIYIYIFYVSLATLMYMDGTT